MPQAVDQDVPTHEHPFRKRQDLGVVPGLPKAIQGLVPGLANLGMLPTIVKSGVNGIILLVSLSAIFS